MGLLLEGRQRFVYQGERQLAGQGDVLLMAPEQIHDGASLDAEGYRIRVLAFEPHWLEQASRALSDDRRGTPRLLGATLRHPALQAHLLAAHDSLLGDSRLAKASPVAGHGLPAATGLEPARGGPGRWLRWGYLAAPAGVAGVPAGCAASWRNWRPSAG